VTDIVLTASGIKKFYPGVAALSGVALELRAGEIHSVIGENGSGKSTLLSIIAGAQEPDAGTITVDGRVFDALDPTLARSLGIALVHQEPQLAASLTVGENIMMGRIPGRGGFVGWRQMHHEAQTVLDTLGLDLSSRVLVGDLSTSRRQLVEIAKGLVDTPRVLLLDEATSSLDDSDVTALFELLKRLKEQGVAIAFISHKMTEVMSLADRATVLRDGIYVDSVLVRETDERQLVKMMVGRDLEDYWHKTTVPIGAPLLVVDNLNRGPLRDISLTVGAGEIVGLAGLVGSGRSALMRTLIGSKPAASGSVFLQGNRVNVRSPREAHRLGMGYVPEDRKAEGLVMGWSILRNAALSIMNTRAPLAFLGSHFDRQALERGSRGLRIK
jgi:ABC-type sugar transport system ATPase subunit